ncbi:diphthine--ammonia ligase [archaeon]|nr:diphthine--ammonia ligase [archaeon]
MDVAVLYSGGKDSSLAIDYCMNKGWNIKYLISVKPNRTDCYLFHYATVEHTKELAKILGIKQFYLKCKVADPEKEAEIVKEVVEKNKVDALVLGGIGLQETQIRTLQKTMMPLGVEVFASHAHLSEEESLNEMLSKGYKIIMTQFASDGLNFNWLGKEINKKTLEELRKLSIEHGFNFLGEGGYYDTLVIDGPIFNKRLKILSYDVMKESDYSGYIKINKIKVEEKSLELQKET